MPLALDHGDRFTAAGYAVERVPVVHGVKEQCFGYVLERDGLRVGFSGDTTPCPALEAMVGGCRHCICECTLSAASPKHMGIDALLALHEKYPGCRLYTTHMTDGAREKLQERPCDGIEILDDDRCIVL